nr:HAD-IB family phosphatase [Candidatus Sigynarchaeota archaeon]
DQPGIIAKVSEFFAKYNINIESCKMIARGTFFSMELVIDTSKMIIKDAGTRDQALAAMKRELKELCTGLNQSVVIQSENIYRKVKKLIVFDVESTLLQEDSLKDFLQQIKTNACIEPSLLNQFKGTDIQSLVENTKMLKGVPICDFQRFSSVLDLNPGSIELITILKSMGFKIALLSSGFGFLVKKIFEKAGVDYAFSNSLKVDKDGLITGELEDPIITDKTKNEILEFIMNVENINRDQVIAVGDGSTRSHFMKNVGLSIAFRPRSSDVVSDGVVDTTHIKDILFCLGVPKSDLDKALDKKQQ